MQSIKINEQQNPVLVIAIFIVVIGFWIYASLSDLRTVVGAKYPDQIALLIAFHSKNSSGTHGSLTEKSCSYLLIPSVFTSPAIITVKQVNDGTPSLHEEAISPFFMVIAICSMLYGVVLKIRKRNA
jgi:hypothetical protein